MRCLARITGNKPFIALILSVLVVATVRPVYSTRTLAGSTGGRSSNSPTEERSEEQSERDCESANNVDVRRPRRVLSSFGDSPRGMQLHVIRLLDILSTGQDPEYQGPSLSEHSLRFGIGTPLRI